MDASRPTDRSNGIAFHGGYEIYSESGVDLTLLRANLKVLAQSEVASQEGLTIHVLSLEGLIAAKRVAGCAKDQTHLLELLELQKSRETPQQTRADGAQLPGR